MADVAPQTDPAEPSAAPPSLDASAASGGVVRVYDTRTGHPLDLSPEDAQRAFQQGRAGFKKGSSVPVYTPDGELAAVEASRLHEALGQGASLASDDEWQKADDEARYGGFGNELRTGVEGAARNISLGLSDAAIIGLGGDRAALEGRRRANPTASTIGEGAGLVASLALPGLGEANVAKAAKGALEVGDALKGVEAARAGEAAHAAVLAENTAKAAQLSRTATEARAAADAARGGSDFGSIMAASSRARTAEEAENAAQAAINLQNASEAAHASATADRVAAEAAHADAAAKLGAIPAPSPLKVGLGKAASFTPSALLGRLGSHAEGAIEAGLREVYDIDKSSGLLARTFGKAASVGVRSALEGAVYGGAGQLDEDILGDHEVTAQKLLAAMGHGALYAGLAGGALGAGGELLGDTLSSLGQRVSHKADELASGRAFAALGAREAVARKIEKMVPGGIKAVGKALLTDVGLAIGDTAESIIPKLDGAVARVGEKIGAIADASGATIKTADVFKAIDSVIAPVRQKIGFRAIADSLESYKAEAAERWAGKESVTFQEFLEQRKALDELAYKEQKALDPKARVELLRNIRTKLEHLETSALDDAQKAVGSGATAKEYKDLKLTYQKLKAAQEALATRKGAGALTNRILSPSDHAAGIGGAIAGELAGEAAGHVLAGGVIGSALGLANKALRHTGAASSAVILSKIADLGAMQRTVAGVDAKIGEAVEGALSPRAQKAVKGAKAAAKGEAKRRVKKALEGGDEGERAEYDEKKAQVERAIAEPERAQAIVQPMLEHAPNTAAAFGNAVKRATAFLASKLPQVHQDSLTPTADADRARPEEIAKFLRYARTIDDPTSVLSHLKAGTLTQDELEAAEAVYPDLVTEIRQKVQDKLVERKEPLPLDQETTVRLMLGLRSGALDPAFVAAMQGHFPPAPSSGPPAPQGVPGAPGAGKGKPPDGLGRPVKFENSVDVLTSAQASLQNKKR